MPFWSQQLGVATGAIKEPKRKFRFTVEFTGISSTVGGGGGILWYAKTVSKPSFQIAATEHKYLNHTYYYPGSVTWQDVSLTLVDPVDPDMASTLADIVQSSGYVIPKGVNGTNDLSTMSKAKAAAALGDVIITQLDSRGAPLETWKLRNAFIINLKFGDLAYGEDELTELTVDLKYDWATVAGKGSAVLGAGNNTEFFTQQS